jgi:hypothetical protein
MSSKLTRLLLPLAYLLALAASLSACGGSSHSGKWRVVMYGDSLSVESGPHIARALTNSKQAIFINRATSGSAPCDWRELIRHDVAAKKNVEFAIVEIYGNNASRCQLRIAGGFRPRTDSTDYWTMYRKDIKDTLALFPASVKVMLVAAPAASVDRITGHSHKARMLAMMATFASHRDNTFVVDAGLRVEEPAGHFARITPCAPAGPCPNHPSRGLAVVRSHDGLHFCPQIVFAKTELLKHCPVISYGAWRFGLYQAVKAARAMGITISPPPLTKT